jgi:K+-sensing histidine kinase KdpD
MLVSRDHISVEVTDSQLQTRDEALRILLEMGNFLSRSLVLDEVLDGALHQVIERFDFHAGRIYLMEPEAGWLSLAAFRGLDSSGLERVSIDEGFTGMAARTRSFIAHHITELPDRKRAALLLGKGFRSIVCVPLIAMDRVVGVMNLASERPIELDPARIDLLIAIANQIAVAIHNAQVYQALQGKVEELKVQKKAIEFFAYSISHDLKSPAVAIFGLVKRLHALFHETLGERGRLYCDQILKGAEQIVRLVDKINEYIKAKEAPLHLEKVQIGEIVESIRQEFAEQLSVRHIEWSGPLEAAELIADRLCLTRVLRNLVENALKHGGPQMRRIALEYAADRERHILRVWDDGVGIGIEDAQRIFGVFQRAAGAAGLEGAGLGLAIVREIVQRHGGEVWLDMQSRGGTEFSFSISKNLVLV